MHPYPMMWLVVLPASVATVPSSVPDNPPRSTGVRVMLKRRTPSIVPESLLNRVAPSLAAVPVPPDPEGAHAPGRFP